MFWKIMILSSLFSCSDADIKSAVCPGLYDKYMSVCTMEDKLLPTAAEKDLSETDRVPSRVFEVDEEYLNEDPRFVVLFI